MVRVIRKVSTLIQPTSMYTHLHPNYQSIGQTVIRAPQWKKVNTVRTWSLGRLGKSYTIFSITRPFLCSSVTGLTLLSMSDVMAQFLTSKDSSFKWNRKRTLGMALFGGLYYGTFLKGFYIAYDVVIGSGALWQALAKTFCDLMINSPIFMIPMYYGITCAVQGYSKKDAMTKFEKEFMTSWLGTIGFWLPGCTANFYLVPPPYRVLFISSLSFLHKTWLSWFTNNKKVPPTDLPNNNLKKLTPKKSVFEQEITFTNSFLNKDVNSIAHLSTMKSINLPKIILPSQVFEHAI